MTPNAAGRQPGILAGLVALAALFLLGSGAVFVLSGHGPQAASGVPAAALYGLALDAKAAATGDQQALGRFQQSEKSLEDADSRNAGAPFANDARFTRLMGNAGTVLHSSATLMDAGGALNDIQSVLPRLTDEATALTSVQPAPAGAAAAALEHFQARAAQLQLEARKLIHGGADAATPQHLSDASDDLGQLLQGFEGSGGAQGTHLTSPDAAAHLKTLDGLYAQLAPAVKRLAGAAVTLGAAQGAARAVATDAPALAGAAAGTSTAPLGRALPWLVPALLAVSLAFLVAALVLALNMRRAAMRQRASSDAQKKESDRNQQAILRLLDELSSLADGDLTVQATVTEDITGAIADSINYAVDALRGLVTTINGSAIQLDSATRQTQALSQHLAKASGAQSKQIAGATEYAASMASSVEEVSGNAERAADVARHSVEVAHKGGDAVRRTIDGMNAIRETIQETSKRIKRLGESSQEIGNIVELINDIAEQTNILALNASIQSSMAGEAGRGFAVVADEVQRLAERAANATKQIEVLVRTIQTDTNEAVVSMERSTTDVVGGALLAENAGAALEEIEQVSNQIASLVQNISGSARQQTGAAQNIARNMQVLKEISAQTAESTHATSAAIAKLAELSAGLRKSASGFRLPGSGNSSGATATSTRRVEDATLTTAKVRQISALGGS
jgi:twitching motility protein PilJ